MIITFHANQVCAATNNDSGTSGLCSAASSQVPESKLCCLWLRYLTTVLLIPEVPQNCVLKTVLFVVEVPQHCVALG